MVGVFISDFKDQLPPHELEQEAVLRWLAKAHSRHGANRRELEARLLALGTGPQKVQMRRTFYTDCQHENWDEMQIHAKPIEERMAVYDVICQKVVEQLYAEGPVAEELIHVSCTGYVAPSPLQRFVAKKGLLAQVTHAYHMGCYAAVPALRIAQGFLATGKKSVDIVHTELCTLHMGTHRHTLEQLIAETLFGDGLIKYTVSSRPKGFEVLKVLEEIVPNTHHHMRWDIESWGMGMTLAIDVPLALGRAIKRFVKKLYPNDLSKVYFAIHPGGPKIIEQIRRYLKLEDWQVSRSLDVLQKRGNMSSATLPHIWQQMQNDLAPGQEVISLAFGPGLTLVGAHLKCC